jgi:hypothetical protein
VGSTLRDAIRVIAQAVSGSQSKRMDRETAKRIVKALMVVWKALQKAWPKFRDWFRKGLTDEEWRRYTDLANKLPGVSPDERAELLLLTKRGLRLDTQSAADTEREIPDVNLDAPVEPDKSRRRLRRANRRG